MDKILKITQEDIDHVLHASSAEDPRIEVLEYCLSKVMTPLGTKEQQIAKFQYILNAIKFYIADPKASKGDLQNLLDLGTTLLAKLGITVSSVKDAHLYADLYLSHAKSLKALSLKDSALWSLTMADHFISKTNQTHLIHEMTELRATILFEEGQLKQANMIFESLIESQLTQNWSVIKLHLRCLRLQRSWDKYHQKIEYYKRNLVLAAAEKFFQSEELVAEVMLSGDCRKISLHSGKGKVFNQWPHDVLAAMYLYGNEQKSLLTSIPKVNTLRKRSYGHEISPTEKNCLTFIYHLQEANQSNQAILQKLINIEKAEAVVPLIQDPEYRLLAWASLFRWALRNKQRQLSANYLDNYNKLSQIISNQSSSDCLNILSNVDNSLALESYWVGQIVKKIELEKPMPVSSTKRGALLAKIAGKALLKLISSKLGFRPSTLNTGTHYEEIFRDLVATLGMLKGPVLKVGQHFYTHPGVGEKEKGILEGVFFDVPPVEWEKTRLTIEKELSQPLTEVFEHIDSNPISAASIGQVHRARLVGGKEVVIKVLYPKIRDVIKSDLRSLRILLQPILKSFYKNIDVEGHVREIGALLIQESDYELEVKNHKLFKELYKNHQHVIIPEIIDSLCSKNMIVMSYEQGESLMDFANNASDDRKQHVFSVITRMYGEAYFKHGIFQGDVHPYNFLINEDKVVFLDFGFTVSVPPERVKLWSQVLGHTRHGETDKIVQTMFDFFGKEKESIEGFIYATSEKLAPLLSQIHADKPFKISFEEASQIYQKGIELNMDARWHPVYALLSSEDILALRLILAMNWLHVALGIEVKRGTSLEELINFYDEDGLKQTANPA